MDKVTKFNIYWERVAAGVCTDCGQEMATAGKKRGELCLERVKEYNKNRRGELVRTTPTPKQTKKATVGILEMVTKAKQDVEAYNK